MKKKKSKTIKLILRLITLVFVIVLTCFIINRTFSRFENTADVTAQLDTAFYIVDEDYQTMQIKLDSIVPQNQEYEYDFSISNTDGTNRVEVNLEYDLVIVATTNLPLEYKLYKNGGTTNIIPTGEYYQDEYGTYFLKFEAPTETFGFTQDQTNTYKLKIKFPATTENKDIIYQDIIEGIEIQVNSKQVIDDIDDRNER